MGDPAGGIREFYAGRSVFITGVTGFLGKVTVEKLLRSCPEIDKLYMLVRPNKGKSADERLKDLLSSQVFDRLKSEQDSFAKKIILVNGNIELEGLGITPEDLDKLLKDTSVIIHNAATIRFTEPMKKAVKINIGGLYEMIKLARQMPNLEAFVHVSTAYSNCNKTLIKEQIYKQRVTPHQLLSAACWLSDEEMKNMTPGLLNDYPNTYTFTKAVAEILLNDERGDIPTAIVRPSIIVSAIAEPYPGWTDSLAGTSGIFALQGVGLLRRMQGNYSGIADNVPVDIMANSSIVAGWKIARDRPKDVYIVNLTSGQINPLTWGQCLNNWIDVEYKYPCEKVIRPPTANIFYTSNTEMRSFWKAADQYVPGILFEALAIISGQKPRYFKTLKSFGKFRSVVEYFSSNEWTFENKNLQEMCDSVPEREKEVFNIDLRSYDWPEFTRNWWLGTRQFMWREDLGRQAENDKRFKRLVFARMLAWLLFGLIVMFILAKVTGMVH